MKRIRFVSKNVVTSSGVDLIALLDSEAETSIRLKRNILWQANT